MDAWWLAPLLGLSSGLLVAGSGRAPILGWIALAPLGGAVLACPPGPAAVAGALAGGIGCAAPVWTPTLRALVPISAIPGAVAWALVSASIAGLVPDDRPAWLLVALPAGTVLATLPLRVLGAPRWVSNPLARSQERWLAVVHTARLGGDLATSATLALASATLALPLAAPGAVPAAAPIAGAGVVAAVLAAGAMSLRRAVRRVEESTRLRVAAVVADGPPPPHGDVTGLWPATSPGYRDVDATIRRYAPLVERAAAGGARLVVLPEVAVHVDAATEERWSEAVTAWARAHDVAIVAPFLNGGVPRNELAVVDARGIVARYEKQHPGRGLEPPRVARTPVGPHLVRAGGSAHVISTVICVDLDHADLVRPARAVGGLLAAPSNDWFGGFEELHHRTAVWSAVLSGVPVVRATGHGVSAIFDGAGRVIARCSSRDGPVVLLGDVPLSDPA